jgi:hypothetical protein
MRTRLVAFALLAAATVLSCASIYRYVYRGSADSAAEVERLASRVAMTLEPLGFVRLKLAPNRPAPQSGESGYDQCRAPSNRVVFLRQTHDHQYTRTTVHIYSCDGEQIIVVVADRWARDEPEQTRAALDREFADELKSNAMLRKRWLRITLD